jgi:hypothetical protein
MYVRKPCVVSSSTIARLWQLFIGDDFVRRGDRLAVGVGYLIELLDGAGRFGAPLAN